MADERSLIVFGAGGHAAVVVEIVESAGGFRVAGVADDDPERHGTELLGYPVRPLDAYPSDRPVVVAIGDNAARSRIAARLEAAHRPDSPPLVHARATVSERARLAPGTVVMAGAVVNARATVGAHGIINTGATIDHDCALHDFVHVSPGANLAGGVVVGARTQVGAGAVIIPGVTIGTDAVVGAGAVAARDFPDRVVAFGNPARVVRNL